MLITFLATMLMAYSVPDSTVTLHSVTVEGQHGKDYQMRTSQSAIQVNRDYLQQNFSGSLMQTLEGIPGVKAMSIGSGQSKPMIRGLGFNRMVVSDNGIKHEGQQWGDDHGLEIDQFTIDRVEVIKGPGALLYGSDAIGGVLSLYGNHIPTRKFEGTVQLFGRSNNDQIGVSAKIGGRSDKWFYRANMTLIDYADYRVPTDSIQYYSYYIKLKDRRLRNTAGSERDGSVMLGYLGYRFHTDLTISDNYSKSGFFANAHGLEVRMSGIDYDHSVRDIDLPYQWVNHLKIHSHTTWQGENITAEANLAYQNNVREELSEPVSHGYMPCPDGSLERRFNKNTYTANFSLSIPLDEHNTLSTGVNGEYQHNRRGGWGFIIPDFENVNVGLYALDNYVVNERLKFNAGIRYDYARTSIHSYHDWYKTPTGNGDSTFVERASDMRRNFNSFTWSVGSVYNIGSWVMKMNVGKSFRVPIAKELGADGINYHIFRYERGNNKLDPEEAYEVDATVHYTKGRLSVSVDPYISYFPNYIYLNPTYMYVEGLQLYEYTQARVLRWGIEAQLNYFLTSHWEAEVSGEYLNAEQKSGQKKGYTLPFAVPWSINAGIKYSYDWKGKGFIALKTRIVGKQNEIVPPEKPTDGHWTLNLSAGKLFPWNENTIKIALHADNLLNKRYYDHTSYYRLIDVPEPGFNVSAMVGLEF